MKVAAQTLLVIFFVIFFFVSLISATFKFQILDYNFWLNTFSKHNVYQNLTVAGKSSFESQVGNEGGNKDDVKVLTDLITTSNTKEVIDRNLKNFLSYANGTSTQINVYVPIDKVPKNLLPKNFSGLKTDMTLKELLTIFNFQDWQNLNLDNLSQTGLYSTYAFAISIFLISLVTFFMIILVAAGERFVALGISFILSGALALFAVQILSTFQTAVSKSLVTNTSVLAVFVGTVAPPTISEIISVWQILGLLCFGVGVGLFFIKKND